MGYYLYKKFTLTVNSNKDGKRTLKVKIFSLTEKSNAYGILTAYFGVETFTFKKQQTDKEGRILILDVSTNHSEYILISLYNANTEEE